MTFTFAHPWLLLALFALPLLAWLKGRRDAQPAFLYSSVQLVRGLTGEVQSSAGAFLRTLRWLALAAFIIALARPQLGEGETKVSASGIDIVIAIDLSRSMEAEDFKDQRGNRMNRLALAKETVQKFVLKRVNDRIGLIAFAGRAYVAAPLTLDHEFFLQNLARLGFDGIEEGTAIGSGLIASVNRLRDLKAKSKIIILLTDGQNNAGKVQPLTAAEAAQALGIKCYTIGVGTHGDAPWPYTDAFGRRRDRMLPVDIDEDVLKKVSEKTNGKYFRADNSETLRSIFTEIDRMEKTTAEVKKFQRYREFSHWLVALGLGLLLVEIVLANTVWRKLP
ncbi:MAG: VWA domain-containing protein [Verrucomicrobia bacterium]|nr:VWA domain-containing protein [Verrucomicrobiota bacterium]NBU08484.1 VWA domain-containing protein [Pseudomonadota bacterium]NDA67035.1 VWA domain-containing protein [Verrucomicrobiota bacterium]NDB76091.1 VWA domain-containing protein [Verrucomicrobiota bacterium]NDD38909.1 VWA domain-containing protein [Verrucomicrobiota bacterium]